MAQKWELKNIEITKISNTALPCWLSLHCSNRESFSKRINVKTFAIQPHITSFFVKTKKSIEQICKNEGRTRLTYPRPPQRSLNQAGTSEDCDGTCRAPQYDMHVDWKCVIPLTVSRCSAPQHVNLIMKPSGKFVNPILACSRPRVIKLALAYCKPNLENLAE